MKKSFILRTVLMSLFLLTNFISAQSVISDVQCSNNGTFDDATDDFVSFKIALAQPSPYVSPQTYTVTATFGGNPVAVTFMDGSAATNIEYKDREYFKIATGTLGAGNFTVTITPNSGASEILTFTNPGTCSVPITGTTTGNVITYYYYAPKGLADFINAPVFLPKFDQGSNRVLTKAKFDYGSDLSSGYILENTGNLTAGHIKLRAFVDLRFSLAGYTFNDSQDILTNADYPNPTTVPGSITVPAQGSWPGDTGGSTLKTMSNTTGVGANFINYYLGNGLNPTASPYWVTQLTGNATHDDDMLIYTAKNVLYNNNSSYTAAADLTNFIGTGDLPGFFETSVLSSSAGGGNSKQVLRTTGGYYFKVEYTYDTTAAVTSTITDVQCSNNGTFNTAADDFVAFKLNPQPPGGIVVHPFKYNISATYLGNPVTITDMAGVAVTQGNYGENPYYRINNGTIAAAGNIVITLTAQFGAMTQEVVNLTNPGTCSTVCTGASTGNKVTYYYENVLLLDQFTSQNATLPKFDEGTSRTLTGVKIDYGFTASGSVYGENREPNPQTLRIKTEIEPYQFDINTVAHPIASKIIVQTPGYPTSIPVVGAVLVPASGAWPGDDPGVAPDFTASTLIAMGYYANTWLESAFASGIDPTTNPLWVTQLTGNAGDDDDITVAVNPTFAFNAPSINLTAPLDLNAYKGASTFPIAVDAYGSFTGFGSGGQYLMGQATKARYFVKVEYTYDCINLIDAVDDYNTTPVNGATGGDAGINVYDNDTLGSNPATASNVTLTSTPNGPLTVNPDGSVSVAPNTPAGTYTIDYTICDNANPGICDTATVTVVVETPCGSIDNFSAVQNASTNTLTNDYSVITDVNILGGERDIAITNKTGAVPYVFDVNAGLNILDVGHGSGENSSVSVQWDGVDGNATLLNHTGLGGLNFSDLTKIVIPIFKDTGVSGRQLPVTLELWTDSGNASSLTITVDNGVSTANLEFLLSNFTPIAGSGVNLNNIGAIVLKTDTTSQFNSFDYSVGSISYYGNCTTILANNDTNTTPINGNTGGLTDINVYTNDLLNGAPVNPADVTLTTGTIPTGIVLDVTTGAVSVNPGTPAGNYTFTYQICEVANPTNCDDAVVSVMVTSNVVALSNITCNPNGTLEDGSDDYITFSMLAPAPVLFYEAPYTYSVTATQNGNPVTVTLSDGSPATNVGYNSLAESFRLANGSSNNGDVTVTVTPNWGSYAPNSIVLVNPGSCTLVACSGGTNKTVTYTYQSPILLSGLNNQIFIPKFNQTGGKVLTGVAINYTSNARNFVIIEGTGNGGNEFSGIIKFRPLFKYNGVNVSTPTDYLLWQSPSYDGGNTYDILGTGVAITVPAQGAWTGDVSSSTLNAMPWTSNSVYAGIDPRTDPRWVTNITGNSTFDDDFYFSPFYNTYNYNGSVNYTSSTDLASFTGASGNVPFTYSHNIPGTVSIGGSGISIMLTQVYFTTTVTYTYTETCIDAVLDINQTPINVPVSGNVITNDEFTGTATVTSAQFYNASGVLTNLPIGTATPVFTPAGVPAGTMLLNADGTYTYTPTTGFVGEIPVNYTLTNNLGSTDSTTLTIKVIPNTVVGNDNPIAQHDTSFTEEGVSVSSTVLNNDSDPDGDALTVTSATGLTIGTATVVSGVNAAGTPVANAGTVQLNANGTYTYVPAAGFVGTVNPLPYVISDGNGGTATANIYITVVGAGSTTNNTFANDDANTAPKGVTMTGNVKTNDTDPEGNTTTVTAATVFSVNGVANGTALTIGTATVIPGVGSVTLNANGTYSFVPVATYVGTVVIPYTICDNGVPQACDQATLELTSLDIVLTACYDLPNTATAGVDTKHGITILQRAGADNGNWPMIRKSAHTALESNTKGFVITRMTTAQITAIVSPQEGMMVYDTVAKCLKLYDGTVWSCFSTPACP